MRQPILVSLARSSPSDPAILRRRLMIATVLAECVVVPVTAWTAFRLAGGDPAIAAPLLAVSALEACRIPLSSYATRLKPIAKLIAIATLAGIGILTAEVMTVGFSSLLEGRLAPVTEARDARDASRERLAADREALDRLAAEAATARASLADLSAHPPALADVRSQTCRTRKGASFDCTPSTALRANAAAQAAYDSRLHAAQEALREAEDRLRAAPGLRPSEEALEASEARLRAAMAANPMAQLAAGLTDRELDQVKSVVAVSLGFAVAFATSLLAFLAHLEPRVPGRESRLARAIRGWVARRRRPIYRNVPGPVQFRDRFVHVPVDELGRVLSGPKRAT